MALNAYGGLAKICRKRMMGKEIHYAEACMQNSHLPRRPGGLELTRRGLKLCAFAPGAKLVDMGCGTGATVRLLRSMGFDAAGIDINMVQQADFPFIHGDISGPLCAGESFHGIVCECVLSLMQNKLAVLEEFWRIAMWEARLLLSDVYESEDTMKTTLCRAGWKVRHFENMRRELKLYAAQMLWHGEPFKNSCGQSYGLWIAEKTKREA